MTYASITHFQVAIHQIATSLHQADIETISQAAIKEWLTRDSSGLIEYYAQHLRMSHAAWEVEDGEPEERVYESARVGAIALLMTDAQYGLALRRFNYLVGERNYAEDALKAAMPKELVDLVF